MTAQPTTKLTTADFTAALRSLNSGDDSISATTTNDNNCFSSEDFQRFLHEHQNAIVGNSSSGNNSNSPSASSSLDQIFKTSEFFKNQQSFSDLFKSQQSITDLFKSQQSFSQMFQSKDSFAELFKSLDSDQKKAIFSSKDPLSPPAFPAMESPSRMSSSSGNNNTIGASLMQSRDWKNLGTHEEVNDYTKSKLFRDTSSNTGSDTNIDPLNSIQAAAQPQNKPMEEEATPSRTNWGDFFFAQLQSGTASAPSPLPALAAAKVAPPPASNTTPVLPLPQSQPPRNSTTNKVARKTGKRYISNPTETDILMGRGGKSNHHPGNKRYREEILNFKKTYSQLTSKEDKTDLSRHVVDYVHKYKGRFLALDKTVSPARWYEITDAVARRKVSQALREDVDPLKRQQKRARFLERKRLKEEQARSRV